MCWPAEYARETHPATMAARHSSSRSARSSCRPVLKAALSTFGCRGRLPVLAHPERYSAVQRDPAVAESLGRQAALLVDLAALSGTGDRAEVKTARRLVEEGMAHAAASDMHDPEDGPPLPQDWLDPKTSRPRHGQAIAQRESPPYLGRPTSLTPQSRKAYLLEAVRQSPLVPARGRPVPVARPSQS